MPRWAVFCPECNYTDNRFAMSFNDYKEDIERNGCPMCLKVRKKHVKMETDFGRLNPTFKLKGGGWALDGYQKPTSVADSISKEEKKRMTKAVEGGKKKR